MTNAIGKDHRNAVKRTIGGIEGTGNGIEFNTNIQPDASSGHFRFLRLENWFKKEQEA